MDGVYVSIPSQFEVKLDWSHMTIVLIIYLLFCPLSTALCVWERERERSEGMRA
jgi:hypothetical protein